MGDREALISLLREKSVQLGDFVLASGQRSTHYVDARRTTMSAQGLAVIGRLGLKAIRAAGWSPDAVGGLTMGADPVAYAIAAASHDSPPTVDAFSVRKRAKEHGAGKQVEGNLEPGHRVVVIEDVVTSGGSALQAIAAVEHAGGVVAGVLTVVDRLEGGSERVSAAGYTVVSLTTITDLGIDPPA